MAKLFLIGIFGVVGVISRFYILEFFQRTEAHSFPFGTFLINVGGSFLIGLCAGFVDQAGRTPNVVSSDLYLAIVVGGLGGFTTFSSYSLDALRLFESGAWRIGLLYVVTSPVMSLMAVFFGRFVCRAGFSF